MQNPMWRAIIIAVRDYPNIVGLSRSFRNADKGALVFRDWVTTTGGVPPQNVVFHLGVEGDQPAGTLPATRTAIRKSLLTIGKEWKDKTERLYFYYSGHGFSFRDGPQSSVDLITTSEFQDLDDTDPALRVDVLCRVLRNLGGKGRHFMFIDACRNDAEQLISGGDLNINDLRPSVTGKPDQFVLQSTTTGAAATSGGPVGSPYASALLDGLNAAGRSKLWRSAKLVVTFSSLAEYMNERLRPQEVEPTGKGDAVIREVSPVPVYACTVTFAGYEAGKAMSLRITRPDADESAGREVQVVSDRMQVELKAGVYQLDLRSAELTATFEPSGPIDVFEDREVRVALRRTEAEPLELGTPLDFGMPDSFEETIPRAIPPPALGLPRPASAGSILKAAAAGDPASDSLTDTLRWILRALGVPVHELLGDGEAVPALLALAVTRWISLARDPASSFRGLFVPELERDMRPGRRGVLVLAVGDERPSISLERAGEPPRFAVAEEVRFTEDVWAAGRVSTRPLLAMVSWPGKQLIATAPPLLPDHMTLLVVQSRRRASPRLFCLAIPNRPDAEPGGATSRLENVLRLARIEEAIVDGTATFGGESLDTLVDAVVGPAACHALIADARLDEARQLCSALAAQYPRVPDVLGLQCLLDRRRRRPATPAYPFWLEGALALRPNGVFEELGMVLSLSGPWALWRAPALRSAPQRP
ncbi:caspase family protein [Sorangium sp. So ce1182]|uniref:caspase family protein n=1 Tax=Sorangium sp. So ce1182 TaxID=3133334 RepID=UPI003F5F3BE2